jgi:hypothetical protein
MQNRPELKSMRLQQSAAERFTKAEHALYFPSLGVEIRELVARRPEPPRRLRRQERRAVAPPRSEASGRPRRKPAHAISPPGRPLDSPLSLETCPWGPR